MRLVNIIFCVCVVLPLVPLHAASEGLPALARFVGTWKSSGDAAATPYMRKGHHEGTTVCEWSSMRSFVVCDQEHTGPEGRGRDLSVYT